MEPIIVNGITFRDWNRALARLMVEASPLGVVPHWSQAKQCWQEGYSPTQAFLLWQEEPKESQKIA